MMSWTHNRLKLLSTPGILIDFMSTYETLIYLSQQYLIHPGNFHAKINPKKANVMASEMQALGTFMTPIGAIRRSRSSRLDGGL